MTQHACREKIEWIAEIRYDFQESGLIGTMNFGNTYFI